MRSWIAVHLPLLPLEALRPCWSDPLAHVVVEKNRVVAMNPLAEAGGVQIGMRRGGVSAVLPDALIQERDLHAEQSTLDSIALALLQFTPEVAHADEGSLLLDVTASLRAFNGRLALCRQIGAAISTLGFTCRIGMAPTALGAWLFARHSVRHVQRRFVRMNKAVKRLDALPCALLPATEPYRDWLEGIGCETLCDMRRLPRAGLQRRCGKEVIAALDQAYGEAAELFEWVQAPPTFSVRIELPDRVEHAEAVLFAARRLLLQLTGWLVALQLAVSRLTLLLEHERGRAAIAPTPIEIALAEPAWRDEHLVRLLKERLSQLQLVAPVIALRLEVLHAEPMMPPTESLFPEPGGSPADYHRLLELLVARLGRDKVLMPAPCADHRPEVCNRWMPAIDAKRPGMHERPRRPRPFWLLEKPVALTIFNHRPFYRSPLRLVSGPERIECGWWDGATVVRDYFIAQGSEAACYWVFRERLAQQSRWFLHGLFG